VYVRGIEYTEKRNPVNGKKYTPLSMSGLSCFDCHLLTNTLKNTVVSNVQATCLYGREIDYL